MIANPMPPAPHAMPRLAASTRRGIIVFAVACALVSGGCWFAAGFSGVDVMSTPATFWSFAIGASGPSIAALIAVIVVRRSAAVHVRLRAPWAWAPLAVVVGALPAVTAELMLDPGSFGSGASDAVIAMGGLFPFIATYLVAGPLAEEFGWRGYLQPRLRTRFGPLATAVIVGAVWSGWHLPLFLLPGTGQHEMGLPTASGFMFLITMIPLSMTFLFLSERLGGGVWSAIIAHFAVNVSMALLPQPAPAGSAIQLAVATVIACGAWWVMRRPRALEGGRPRALAADDSRVPSMK